VRGMGNCKGTTIDLASIGVRQVHVGRLGSCGATVPILKWAGTKGGAFGLRGRLHVRISMPTTVEGEVEGVSDERAVDGLVIIVELDFPGKVEEG
jgi:hypothetical protein